jgi:hypothetical protein
LGGADDPDESVNELAPIAAKYAGRERPAVLDPATPSSSAAMSFTALMRTAATRERGGRSLALLQRALARAVGDRARPHLLACGATHLQHAAKVPAARGRLGERAL